jgi:HlyD family secretion protein
MADIIFEIIYFMLTFLWQFCIDRQICIDRQRVNSSMKKKIIVASGVALFSLVILCLSPVFISQKIQSQELTLYGNVDVRQVDIAFRVQGQVANLIFEEGDLVHQGDLMAALDKDPYSNGVDQERANLQSIQANLENAEKLLLRRLDLIEIGAVSQEDLDYALSNRDQIKANLLQAEASLAIAVNNLSYTKVFAPTDGIVLTRIREPGTVVNAAEPIYSLSVSSPVWIRAYIDEPYLGQVFSGMPAEIHTDIDGGIVYKGQVGFISPLAEFTPKSVETTQLRTDLVYRLRIYVDNPDRGLVQGMPVTVKLNLEK